MANQGGGAAAAAPAQIPTSFGHELRACLRCRLVKTYDQEDFFRVAILLRSLKHSLTTCRIFVKRSVCHMFHRNVFEWLFECFSS
ncbi:hypothetical protein BUALT_Bualt08G0042200 [Buddleja alternifolia]|uniref:Uncharacterized protein n=1 Tax=Buddleja alternifolia TaxID=168488 RepID=A0AAV6XAU0_9LAMI|nr:hypothetical protein BUALT_Bualt08G0042200 [Buddleja alternifolia]